jgi:hypothetical protein
MKNVLAAMLMGIVSTTIHGCSGSGNTYSTTPVNLEHARLSSVSAPAIVDADHIHFLGRFGQLPTVCQVTDGEVKCMIEPTYAHGAPSIYGTYGVIGDTAYCVFNNQIFSFSNGNASVAFHARNEGIKSTSGKTFFDFMQLDAQGGALAFSGRYSTDGPCGVCLYRDGKLTTVLDDTWPLKRSEIGSLVVADNEVYVLTVNAILICRSDAVKRIVSVGDVVEGGRLTEIRSFSAAKGVVAVIANATRDERNYEMVFTVADGKFKMITGGSANDFSHDGVLSYFNDGICTNGETIVFTELTADKVDVGYERKVPVMRLRAYGGGIDETILKTGETKFGGIVTRFGVGPHGIDPKGNIAFAYHLSKDSDGIAVARLK